mmetsp:Transcript_10280/g.31424  ORF Transcript_10280/g.31424 Transcript_10280/m.31424 type:complete len:234 (+) Transcript_10280:3052-3753(+)
MSTSKRDEAWAISPSAKSAITWEMSLMTSRLFKLARNHEDWAKRKSPARTATRVPYRECTVEFPLRSSQSSSTSSCTREAVWIISVIMASLMCSEVTSASPYSFLVALATRMAIRGLTLLPPAWKRCSDAAESKGCLSPTMFRRPSVCCCISPSTGLWMRDRTSLELAPLAPCLFKKLWSSSKATCDLAAMASSVTPLLLNTPFPFPLFPLPFNHTPWSSLSPSVCSVLLSRT